MTDAFTQNQLQFFERMEDRIVDRVCQKIDGVSTEVNSVKSEVRGVKKTVFGEDGREGIVGDVKSLKIEAGFTKAIVLFFILPVMAGLGVVVSVKFLGLA